MPWSSGLLAISSSIAVSNALSHSAFEIFGPVLLGFVPFSGFPGLLAGSFALAESSLFGISETLLVGADVGSSGLVAEATCAFGRFGSSPARRVSDTEFAGVWSSA
jgi:hypothetical protein